MEAPQAIQVSRNLEDDQDKAVNECCSCCYDCSESWFDYFCCWDDCDC
ncbi:hypothetical protein IC582_018143 [Cucumis melo]